MIKQSTFDFLKNLENPKNNNTRWFHAHRDTYQTEKKNFIELVEYLMENLGEKYPDLIEWTTVSNSLYRINRDIRYSRNKHPYKKRFAAQINMGWKKQNAPGIYIHIQWNNRSYVWIGIYKPDVTFKKRIRKDSAYSRAKLDGIISRAQKKYPELHLSNDWPLRAKPYRGFTKDADPNNIWLLREHFLAWMSLSDEIVLSESFWEYLVDFFESVWEFFEYLMTFWDW